MNIAKTLMLVATFPDDMVTPQLMWWAQTIGLTPEQMRTYEASPVSVAYNQAVRLALASPYDTFIFSDRDLRPSRDLMAPWLEADADIVCVQYPVVTGPSAWAHPDAFHTGLWRTSRKVLAAIRPPWFAEEYTADGTRLTKCVCGYFRDKAIDAGFTVRHAGWADHKPRRPGTCRAREVS